MEFTITDLLDDLRVAEERLHKFEQKYHMSSADFYALISRGLLDNGENMEEFAEWSGHYKLGQKRRAELEKLGVLQD